MAVVRVERGWRTAIAGRPVNLMLFKSVANPLVVVDEICKSPAVSSTRGKIHVFADALLSLPEPARAADWECPYFRVKFDMSHISWVLTSNAIEYVPETIRSRCQVIEIPDVTSGQLQPFAHKKGRKIGLSENSFEAVAMAIAQALSVTRR